MVVVFGFAAFSVDLGYLGLTKTQLRSGVDATALGTALELSQGLGKGPTMTSSQVVATANAAAVNVAQHQPNAGQASSYLNTSRDVRYGSLTWNSATGQWNKAYGVAPYNLVEVTFRRDQAGSKLGDGRIPLYFSKTLGINDAPMVETSAAGLLPGVGFQIQSNSSATVGVLPIALDQPTWDALVAGVGADKYAYDPATGKVTPGKDGILEVDLYPSGSSMMPPGNRGQVDLGSPNNSTSDVKRQILYGLNAYDLSFFGGKISTENGPILLNGDTGISAGIKAELTQIIGQPRLIPIFSAVSGPGNNAVYTVPKFVPIRILNVQLTGNPKSVAIQPAPFSSSAVISGHVTISSDSYFTTPRLVE
jgi:Flp pilus assembly protein TadG